MKLSDKIKQEIPIQEYLERCGYHLVRHGARRLRTVEHDSLVIDPEKNLFWWNSKDAQGSVIDLVMLMEGVNAEQAIKHLAALLGDYDSKREKTRCPNPKPVQKKAFEIPVCDPNNWKRIYAYLLKTRGLDERVVRWLAKEKLIYPDERGNLVYVSGQPSTDYAALKGTASNSKFRKVVSGSNCDARASWLLPGTVGWFVCEAAIDCWSIMSILVKRGDNFRQYGFISLEGSNVMPLKYHLAREPTPPVIWLAQDADSAGQQSREAAKALLGTLEYSGAVKDCIPPIGKDWNDTLKQRKE